MRDCFGGGQNTDCGNQRDHQDLAVRAYFIRSLPAIPGGKEAATNDSRLDHVVVLNNTDKAADSWAQLRRAIQLGLLK